MNTKTTPLTAEQILKKNLSIANWNFLQYVLREGEIYKQILESMQEFKSLPKEATDDQVLVVTDEEIKTEAYIKIRQLPGDCSKYDAERVGIAMAKWMRDKLATTIKSSEVESATNLTIVDALEKAINRIALISNGMESDKEMIKYLESVLNTYKNYDKTD